MELSTLTAISPIDGRYRNKVEDLHHWFSEFALIKYRCAVEVAYFEFLCKIPLPELADIDKEALAAVKQRVIKLNLADAQEIKKIEKRRTMTLKQWNTSLKKSWKSMGL